MTARVCPVHGEYSVTGACRWCEPEPETEPTPWIERQLLVDWGAVDARPDSALRAWLRAPPSWRIEYADPARLAATNFEEEARLAGQHAALRWERVARRWNCKHREPGGLDEEGRATVWRYWAAFIRTAP